MKKKKLGLNYQELVAEVEKALKPTATISQNTYLIGPDGKREVDVDIREIIEDKTKFTMVEAKDLSKPVNISIIDGLDSKRQYLNANRTLIYANSGFSKKALGKASRKQISTLSALKSGEKNIKIEPNRFFYAKRVTFMECNIIFHHANKTSEVPIGENNLVLYKNVNIDRLIWNAVNQLGRQNTDSEKCTSSFFWDKPKNFSFNNVAFSLSGISLVVTLKICWLRQLVSENATLGNFDHQTGSITIPSGQAYILGFIDNEKWELTTKKRPKESEIKGNSFSIELTYFEGFPEFTKEPLKYYEELFGNVKLDNINS